MQFKDYYEVLGLNRAASADEVRRAYRKLAHKYHPDISAERNAEAKFKELQEAYEVLKDPEKRAAYDQLGRNFRSGQQFRAPPEWGQRFGTQGGGSFSEVNGFSDFFSTLFGGAGPEGPTDSDAGILEVTVEEAYAGTKRRVTLGGSGGRGRPVEVQIPAGVTDGQALRIAAGSNRAPVQLRVRFLPHALFSIQARDVQLELPVAPWEAALGTKVAVPTLGGTVELTIPAGAQSGQKLRLRGRGLPGNPAGDQLVLLKLVTPLAESPQAKAAYERLKREFDFDPRANWPAA